MQLIKLRKWTYINASANSHIFTVTIFYKQCKDDSNPNLDETIALVRQIDHDLVKVTNLDHYPSNQRQINALEGPIDTSNQQRHLHSNQRDQEGKT